MTAEPDVGFRDPDFREFCDFVYSAWDARRAPRRLAVTAWRWLPRIPAGLRALRRLPRREVVLSDTPAGREIAGNLTGSTVGVPNNLAVSLLDIPADGARYLRGRSRQALRTNCSRARASGLRCRPMSGDEARERTTALLERRGERGFADTLVAHLEQGHSEVWLAHDEADGTAAIALITTDGAFAHLVLMLGAPREENPEARYLLSAHLVSELSARGIDTLAVDSALLCSPGLRHFQQLLGFVPTTLRISSARTVSR